MSEYRDMIIDIMVRTRAEGTETFGEVKQEVQELGTVLGLNAEQWKDVSTEVRDATRGYVVVTGPIRSLSWDFMLMGRGLSILNTHLLGNNEAFKRVIGTVYVFASILRIITAAIDVMRGITMATVVLQRIQNTGLKETISLELAKAGATSASTTATNVDTAANVANAASLNIVNKEKATFLGLSGPAGWALLAGAAVAIAAFGIYTASRSMQTGGVVPETGLYYLHKDEMVVPAGMTYNQIFINMTTGAISSEIDVDNMLDAMALRMAQESRRRLGR